MADVTSLHPGEENRALAARRERRRATFVSQQEGHSKACSGFSARLNMLCGLAGERELNNGRLEDIAALNPQWQPEVVRGWFLDDQPPAYSDLQALVGFLTDRLEGDNTDAQQWQAYLLYGGTYVRNPMPDALIGSRAALWTLASRTLSDITREYRIPASSYDADLMLKRTIDILSSLNITDAGNTNLQPGHRRMIVAQLFPDSLSLE